MKNIVGNVLHAETANRYEQLAGGKERLAQETVSAARLPETGARRISPRRAKPVRSGFRRWYRPDISKADFANEMKGYALLHETSDLLDRINGMLNSGGDATPTMQRLRKGISIRKTGGQSLTKDLETGLKLFLYPHSPTRPAKRDGRLFQSR